MSTQNRFENIAAYFQRSTFDYLALDHGGRSIRLSREPAQSLEVTATRVGFIEAPAARGRFPHAGDGVLRDEPLFAIRTFRNVLTLSAPVEGAIGSVRVKEGDFVEFARSLATIAPANRERPEPA